MGFWETVGGLAKGAVANMEKTQAEANALAEEYRNEDDDFLKRKLKSGNIAQKFAATKVLKERGYGSQS
ncbi:MAG: hypothetical protein IPH37_11800 [Burkholderiales bacterium]|nr:hypothetical protein [Burkholderiales bacterium]MBK9348113.1 hypothetical protein [Burkholderiales bacterium]